MMRSIYESMKASYERGTTALKRRNTARNITVEERNYEVVLGEILIFYAAYNWLSIICDGT